MRVKRATAIRSAALVVALSPDQFEQAMTESAVDLR
jgi:hypothetical protein